MNVMKKDRIECITEALNLIIDASEKYPVLNEQILDSIIEGLDDLWETVFTLIVLYRIGELDEAAEKVIEKESRIPPASPGDDG